MNEVSRKILEQVNSVIIGKEAVTEKVLMAVLAQGHVLLEDVPGVGKTTMALAFARTLTPKDVLMVLSAPGRSDTLEEIVRAAKERGAPVLILTCDKHGPLAQLADYVLMTSNREQRLIDGSHAASLLSPNILVEVLYYLLRMEEL